MYGRYTKLQQKYGELIEQNQETDIKINGAIFENSRLKTLLAMRDREIVDLNETLALFRPQSPPDFKALENIMDMPNLNISSEDFEDFTFSENPFLDQDEQPVSTFPSSQLAQHDFGQAQSRKDVCKQQPSVQQRVLEGSWPVQTVK